MHISEFDYELPPELIAQEPLERRDASRMLVLDRRQESWSDAEFSAFPTYLKPNDLVVVNNTQVFPARLKGKRYPSGGSVEVLLVNEIQPLEWEALVRPSQRLRKGALLRFGEDRLAAELGDEPGDELRVVRFHCREPLENILEELGQTPLPPYIKREASPGPADRDRYQTIFARHRGAIAAPTAGLHFTVETMKQIRAQGNRIAEITLHVGYGTFAPVRVDQIETHEVAAEWFELSEAAAKLVNEGRTSKGRIVAVGTTTTRALESSLNDRGEVAPRKGHAELTITPGYRFRITDALLTNFHLPRSSLLLLVAAFAGRDLILSAYRHAVKEGYRFYSYGDCMLIL
jgi:S-adenosylmethionine:tRNA ribosyltransferase-isomerase